MKYRGWKLVKMKRNNDAQLWLTLRRLLNATYHLADCGGIYLN